MNPFETRYPPVDPLKVQLINDMLNDPIVGPEWNKFVALGNCGANHTQRQVAFDEYCSARDIYLGFPAPKLQGIVGNYAKTRI